MMSGSDERTTAGPSRRVETFRTVFGLLQTSRAMFAAALVSNCPLILKTKRRVAIRAAEFGPETNAIFVVRGRRNSMGVTKCGGALREQ